MSSLTMFQAYQVMFLFLDDFWRKHQDQYTSDLPAMLGSMQLLADGEPIDAAAFVDWSKAAQKDMQGTITEQEAYDAMLRFLRINQFEDDIEIAKLLAVIQPREAIWDLWMRIVNYIQAKDV